MVRRIACVFVLPLIFVAQLVSAEESEKKRSWYCGIDAMTLFYGTGEKISATELRLRSGEWGEFFASGPWRTSVTLESGLAWWHASKSGDNSGSRIFDLSLTPVLRVERRSETVTPFFDFGIGAHLITSTKINVRKLSTAFQFSEHVGLGVAFGAKQNYELGIAIRHISNASIKKPNNGETYLGLAATYRF